MNESTPFRTVRELYEARARKLDLDLLTGINGFENRIISPRIQKLGLALAGFTDYVEEGRLQILGATEHNFLRTLDKELRRKAVDRVFSLKLCAILITTGLEPPEELLRNCKKFSVPVLRTPAKSPVAIEEITSYLEDHLAPATTIHGVMMEVFGQGVLITGESGIGKSECALDLVLRGHRLVSDDVVVIKRHGRDTLVGSGPDGLPYHMELRGLGIINIRELFGISAVSPRKEIDVVVNLVRWKPSDEYDQLGVDEKSFQLLDTSLPLITMPVAPARNIATLIEVAVRIQMLKKQGYRPAADFLHELEKRMRPPDLQPDEQERQN